MGQRDVKSVVDMDVSLAQTGNRTEDATGSSVEMAGFHGAAVLIITGAYTDGSHAFAIQESDDNSEWNDVDASDLDGEAPTISAAGDADSKFRIGYAGTKRYLRVNVTASGETGATYGAYILKGFPSQFPVE